MKQNKTNLVLLILGAIVLSSSFIIKHYASLSDLTDGFIKGLSIGLLLLSLLVFLKQRKPKTQS